jgi:hypothetical protein
MQHTFYFGWNQTYIQLTKMSVKMFSKCHQNIFYVLLHVSTSQGHLQVSHFMEPTALCQLLSATLVDVCHYSQFWYFENVCSFSVFVLRLLCAPKVCTKYTHPGERNTQRGSEKPQYEDRKGTEIFKIPKLRIMTYINECCWQKLTQCCRFHQNALPEDGPVRSKHVARHRIYFGNILRRF